MLLVAANHFGAFGFYIIVFGGLLAVVWFPCLGCIFDSYLG
jgi:cytochrome c biogenesis protein CcdA